MRLGGQTAVVTGGAAGLGLAIARAFTREGCSVALLDVDGVKAAASAVELAADGGQAIGITGDVADAGSVEAAVALARAGLGRLDILVNCAAIVDFGGVGDTSVDAWERILAVNLTGTFLVSRAVIPLMLEQGGGSIINLGSIAGLVGVARMAAYSATKGAIVSLTRQMAADYSGRGIRVNCICPGIVPGTEMGRTVLASDPSDEALARRLAKYPIGRLAAPEDVASAAVFLASAEAGFITGVTLAVDGGMTAV